MRAQDLFGDGLAADLPAAITIGIDIGSRQAKAALIGGGEVYTAITSSGVDSQDTADQLVGRLLRKAGLARKDLALVVGTGYGRIAIDYEEVPTLVVTEISCHAMGAHALNRGTKTIIDIGGQDAKAIRVDPDSGRVVEFVLNDKCAAGTGRFLERIAELLGYRLDELGEKSLLSQKKIDISSQCVVFAESEVISLKAKGERPEDIAAAIHHASARRVRNLVNRVGLDPELVFSGGVSNNLGMKRALEQLIGHPISTPNFDMVYAGAIGAAVIAQRHYQAGHA
ncbi:MAG TPA: acyl-CoA dehydratase activase [Rhodopseudomonas sp.]|uniref:acyl-CoA dehydratase activase n=1 Tax=Rhodopseudomonas sp. TaxID=1078 RepID=UPI002ED9B15C